jgi:competence ComEA-like helix-hairpin-helix protein
LRSTDQSATGRARLLRPTLALGAFSLVCGAFVVALAARAQDSGPDKAAQAFDRVCSDCHDRDRIVQSRRSKSEWDDILEQMISKGAAGSDQDFELVEQYLIRHYGRVNINHAPADEIVGVLGLSDKDAATIVQYRKDHGDFKDFDSVTKVPDIDASKLSKDAITF